MKLAIIFLIFLSSSLLLTSCRKSEINGDVFIVTKGAVNYKMGLVEIKAIPEEQMKPFIAAHGTSTEFFLDREKYFKQLPTTIISATTDADGKFTIKLPKSGKYAISARAERKILDETEEYYWLIWINVNNGESKKITLSNNKLMEAGSLENVIPVLRY